MQLTGQETHLLSADAGNPAARAAACDLASGVLCADQPAAAWPRWFARTFDVWWQTSLVAVVAGVVLARTSPAFLHWLETPFGWKSFGLMCIPAGLVLDALLQALAGNTPGKAMLGLKVVMADGRRPRLRELLGRNMNLWRAGLGFGLPLVSLFTMARQWLRLRKGGAASYDDKYFLVHAGPVGWFRKTVFGILFCLMFATLVALDAADRQDSRETAAMLAAPHYGWTNPATGRTVRIAPHWKAEAHTGDDGAVLYQFTQHSDHAFVLFASEEAGARTLREYTHELAGGLADGFDLEAGHFEDFRGEPSWVGAGEEKDGAARVRLRVVLSGGKAWRVMVLQAPPVGYTDDLVHELTDTLWDSVAPAGALPPAPQP
ncbi:RDD family protein [Massilia consociata]|uniref:RDD family protein n=1 Tax=Massilia consociata TaxID=760117 RepID=A0ABV6FAG1_9BURK